jgi:UDP-N-acetylmuramoylalanine--D-glutamate ligase
MRISDVIGLKLGILGFGVEGRSVVRALRERGHRETLHIFDDKAVAAPEGAIAYPIQAALAQPIALDLVVRSPGFAPHHPLRRSLDARGVAQTTATCLFLRELRALQVRVIGISGSKGKSTTATLTQLVLEEAGIPALLVGNIGVSGLDALAEIQQRKLQVIVMELSSYQCSDLEAGDGPAIAGLVDLFPEHLDWHESLERYYAAKLRLLTTQRPDAGDLAFYNPLPAALAAIALPAHARPMNVPAGLHFDDGYFWRGAEQLFADEGVKLLGTHNRRNAVSALALAEVFGARWQHLQCVLQRFEGLQYRLQNEGSVAGITWINDAISTAPETVAAALAALASTLKTSTLIVGGQRRGLDQSPLAAALATSQVTNLITLPDTGADVASAVASRGLNIEIHAADSLEEAVALALRHTARGEACLFSPGAPSYNRFKSFQERGALFRRLLQVM